jgi:ubiquitin-protein ligase
MVQFTRLAKYAYQSFILLKKTSMVSAGVFQRLRHINADSVTGYESAAERWSPVQSPETILLSVISMLSSPNYESPANVDAASLWRDNPQEFRKRCRKTVRESLENE